MLWQVSNKTEAVKYKRCNWKWGSFAVIFSLCSPQPPSNILFLNLVLWQTTITPRFWSKLALCRCIVIIDIYIHKIYTNYNFIHQMQGGGNSIKISRCFMGTLLCNPRTLGERCWINYKLKGSSWGKRRWMRKSI